MISLFQCLLVGALAFLGYQFFFRTFRHVVQRLVGLLMGVCLCVLIFFPALSTRIAHVFGIGRGVDFLFYIAHVAALYALAILYLRQRTLQQNLTELTRTLAILKAEGPANSDKSTLSPK